MQKKFPLNIAHRGLSSRFPENSLRAFDEALKAGAQGFECDLRMTADGEIVLFHDDDLRRLCGVKGSVETSNWRDLQKLKVKGQEPIPSLEDFLHRFHTTTLNLEIKKSSRDAVVVESVLRVLTKVRPQGRILFSSFSLPVLEALLLMDPHAKMGGRGILVETSELKDLPQLSQSLQPQTWNIPRQVLEGSWAPRWSSVHIPPLWVWTLDEPHQWQAVLNSPLPFEAIITNKADVLSSFLASRPMRSVE